MKIMIFNQKGGVGKTTTALNLGAGLARWGNESVTLIDLDPQTHLSAAMGFRAEALTWNVSDWLAGTPETSEDAGAKRISERLDLVPGDCNPKPGRKMLRRLDDLTGHLVIDAPPTWNDEVAALMAVCDYILTPMEPEFLSMQGISRLLQQMQTAEIPWSRLRLLLCRYDKRLAVHREVRDLLSERFGDHLLPGVIRNNVRLAEAPGYGQNIFDYAPDSAGAEDYYALVADTLLADDV
jgi:chromosome partitioning protein